jgi:hypothetical protein
MGHHIPSDGVEDRICGEGSCGDNVIAEGGGVLCGISSDCGDDSGSIEGAEGIALLGSTLDLVD